MTDDTIAFLDQVIGGPADLVGHSDGAFVALMVAMQRPDLVNRLVMISGGFDKSGEAVPDMEFDVDQVVQFLGAAYGEVSPDGEAHFPVVVGEDRRDDEGRAAHGHRRAGRGAAPGRW